MSPLPTTGKTTNADVILKTNTFVLWIKKYLTWGYLFQAIGSIIVILLLWIAYRLILHGIKRVSKEKQTPQQSMLISKFVKYAFYIILVIYILSCFGIKLSAIWGAAGIAGVAIGFAAQTSISNLISGLFVLGEHIMKVGDTISVGGITGNVDSVDLLSVKVHTPDNQLVRIPNSSVINSNLTNTSFFVRRRMTFTISTSYDTDMNKALEALLEVPACCPTILKNPAPAAWFESFSENGISLTLAVWFKNDDFLKTRNDCFIAIKKAYDNAKINIPVNRLKVSLVTDENGYPYDKQV